MKNCLKCIMCSVSKTHDYLHEIHEDFFFLEEKVQKKFPVRRCFFVGRMFNLSEDINNIYNDIL